MFREGDGLSISNKEKAELKSGNWRRAHRVIEKIDQANLSEHRKTILITKAMGMAKRLDRTATEFLIGLYGSRLSAMEALIGNKQIDVETKMDMLWQDDLAENNIEVEVETLLLAYLGAKTKENDPVLSMECYNFFMNLWTNKKYGEQMVSYFRDDWDVRSLIGEGSSVRDAVGILLLAADVANQEVRGEAGRYKLGEDGVYYLAFAQDLTNTEIDAILGYKWRQHDHKIFEVVTNLCSNYKLTKSQATKLEKLVINADGNSAAGYWHLELLEKHMGKIVKWPARVGYAMGQLILSGEGDSDPKEWEDRSEETIEGIKQGFEMLYKLNYEDQLVVGPGVEKALADLVRSQHKSVRIVALQRLAEWRGYLKSKVSMVRKSSKQI